MSEPEPPPREAKGKASQTLLGVAPPRIDSSVAPGTHSPVLVRSGTSIADEDTTVWQSAPSPVASPGAVLSAPSATHRPPASSSNRARFDATFAYVRARPVLWMIVLPVLCALGLIVLLRHPARARSAVTGRAVLSPSAAPESSAAPAAVASGAALDELEHRPFGTLSAKELVFLAQGRAQQKRAATGALREKLENNPPLGKDSATQKELLRLAADESTAPDALAALAAIDPPTGDDLLYEVWTGTTVRTSTTELARALLYSPDVRPKASRALAVALDLRDAASCEQYQTLLPRALTDGDRRALHLLTKLNAKRGCGVKKSEDCYACLRNNSAQLTAAINAVKGRRPPTFVGP